MKKTILLPCFLLGGLSVIAQTNHLNPFHPSNKTKNQKLASALLAHQPGATAQKGTILQQRVIAQTSISDDLSVEDTMTFKYSGTRNSKYNYNSLDLTYNGGFGSDYLPAAVFGMQMASKDLLADSIKYYYQGELEDEYAAFYRADNTTDSFMDTYHSGGSDMISKTFHSFNSNNYLTNVIELNNYNSGTTLDSASMRKYFYNTGNTQLVTDTIFQPEVNNLLAPYYANKYHYNSQNLLDSITSYSNSTAGYDVNEVVSILYTSTGKVQRIASFELENDVITQINVDSFGYTGTLPFYTLYQNTYTDISGGVSNVDSYRIVKHIGSNNLPDTIKFQSIDNGAWDNETIATYYYNSYNNPDSLIGYNGDGSFAGRFNFYYETYDDGVTAINDIKQNKDFSLYPNPFSNKINIEWKGAAANQAKIALVNILGQTVYSTNQTLVKGNNAFNIPNINSGNYILLIQDAKGNTWKSKMVKN